MILYNREGSKKNMKFCLNSKLAAQYLKTADEIKIDWNNRKSIPDLYHEYPSKPYILHHSIYEELDPEEIKKYKELTENNLILCVDSLNEAGIAKQLNIPFYFTLGVDTWSQLRAINDLRAKAIYLDAPLFFDMDRVKKFAPANLQIRCIVNICYRDGLPRTDGVTGVWIRPEDLSLYDNYIDVIEFNSDKIRKEEALYRIYAEQHAWPGPLKNIIDNLQYPGENRMLTSDLTKMRMNCGQRCQENNQCHFCYRSLELANPELIKEYKDAKDKGELEHYEDN